MSSKFYIGGYGYMGMATSKTKSVLVWVPGGYFGLDSLQPSLPLAASASILQWAGHETEILDYGTLETLERYVPKSLQESTHLLPHHLVRDGHVCHADTWKERRKYKPTLKALHDQRRQVWEEIASELTALKGLDFVMFLVTDAGDLEAAEYISGKVQRMRPRLKSIAMGPYFYTRDHQTVEPSRHFHGLYVGKPDQSLAMLADRIHDQGQWTSIPHLAFADGVRLCITENRPTHNPDDLPMPAYDPETYTALEERTKAMIFTLEDLRNVNGDIAGKFRLKTPDMVCKEMGYIRNAYGTRSFHLSGAHDSVPHARNLAYDMLSRGLQVRYTRDLHASTTDRATVAALNTSGCVGGAFQADTGSQRLLENFYGHSFTVSDLEQAVRHSKFSNLYTILNLTYPCPEDDFHTESETLRLIERTLPHAADLNPASAPAAATSFQARLKRNRVPKGLRVDEDSFRRAIAQRNVPVRMRAPWAMMAELSGHHGQEKEFVDQFTHQLFSGDIHKLRDTLSQMNKTAAAVPNGVALKPFTSFPDVVGN